MKKKASLLISGITTVAMLAVAVGSFAAWDQLKDGTDAFSASSGTPVVLTVESNGDNFSGKKLVGKSATVLKSNDTKALEATFTPTLTDAGAKATGATIKVSKFDLKVDGTQIASDSTDYKYTVTKKAATEGATEETVSNFAIDTIVDSDTTYTIKVERLDDSLNETSLKDITEKSGNITLEVECTATVS